MLLVGLAVGENAHLLVEPICPPRGIDLRLQVLVHVAQVGDVGQRVAQLLVGQRAPAPVGESRGFVEVDAGHLLHEVHVRNRLAEAAHHGGDLRIEHGTGHEPGLGEDDLDVLARGVEDLGDALVRHQCPERGKVEPRRHGVENEGVIGRGELHEAELRPKGLLTHELGIDGDVVAVRKALAG